MKMIDLVDRLPAQMTEALELGQNFSFHKHTSPIRNVYVSGLGGSGIGANYAYELVRDELKVPFAVGKGYSIPKSVNKFTLAIVSSYSGNTEETLSSFDALLKTGAKIVCVASGGKVIARAKELGLDFIQVPANWPSPRACVGYSIISQLAVLNKAGLISSKTLKQTEGAVKLLTKEQDRAKKEAAKIAAKLDGKTPIIYTTDRNEAVAIRFRQQINENAKALCWHHVIPEMNHNELVGWREENDKLSVIYLRNKDDFERNNMRIEINKTIIKQYTPHIMDIMSKGRNLVEQAFYLTFLCDYVTCYLSDLRNFDSIEVKAIDFLKGELAKL
ncbi:MAG: bifunctional phosphoglucose/phosphomannose isomerase [Bacteroidota bacterium]|jgi:glucose/mannose-6-phosphate isomerase